MGFYGNITNTARTQFQFDRVYPNRYSMESSMSTDGVYAGRYVLIEYDQNPGGTEFYQEIYLTGNKYYLGYDVAETARVKYPQDIAMNEIVRVYTEKPPVVQGEIDKRQPDFYKCTGGNDNGFAVFEKITDSGIAPYTQNYAIDLTKYDNVGRGWDSTVWQKVYTQGTEKYVMIAELNTVVPTFDVVADAPTLTPIAPHFDANSNNVYYQLHYQPQWGMRVRSADAKESSNTNAVPSDENVIWKKYSYDVASDVETVTESIERGAIYYNKAGFDSEIITHDLTTDDIISVEPTGISGNKYNTHNGISNDPTKPDKNEYDIAEDIQEITIMLPSIGNAIAELWDIIYGNKEQNKSITRNHDISWEDGEDPKRNGLRLVENDSNGNGFTYSTDRINTLAGCINSVHDLMGMIIIDKKPTTLNATIYNENKIYYYENEEKERKYWRIHKTYNYEYITKDKFESNGEYYYNGDDGVFPQYGLWNNEVGYVEGLATREVSYEMQELEGFARNFNTIHGLLLEIRKILETGDMLTRDQSTVQGSINVLNDIIAKFTKMTPTNVMIVDELGRVHGAPQTTKQTFTYKNEGLNNGSQNVSSSEESEDCWIYWNVNDDYEKPSITLQHNFTKVEDTTSTADKNTDGANGNGNNSTHGDTIELYTPIVDGMGHIVGKNIETVTLPYGYKTITTNGRNIDEITNNQADVEETNTVASNTQDTVALNSGNYWTRIDIVNDEITLSHSVRNIDTTPKETTNINEGSDTESKNNINIPDWSYDAAGHIIEKHNHKYTLPYGYKTVTVANSEAVTAPASNVTADQVADSTQDTLNLQASNRWIKLDSATEDTIKFGHRMAEFATGTEANKLYGLIQNEDHTDNLNVDNTFEVPCLSFDEAGHITEARTHTVKLPENFDKISITISDTTDVNKLNGTEGIISADTLTDTLTLAEGNRWINIETDVDNDKVTFSHYVNKFTETTDSTQNFNNSDNDKTFTVQTIKWDEAGHLTSSDKKTLTIPDGYKTVEVKNDGVNDTTTSEGVGGSLVAESLVDTLNINTGNRWISLVANEKDDGFKIYHKFAGTVKENGSANLQTGNNTTPSFGEEFRVFTAGIDEAGHVNNLSDYAITLPVALADKQTLIATGSSVITGIGTNEKGSITQTNANIGTLVLTGYNQGTDQGDLVDSDSINSAFAKLQNQMHVEENARTNADTTLTTNLNQEIEDRKTAVTTEENARKAADTTLTENLNKEIEDRQTAVQGEATARTEAIEQAIAQEVIDRDLAISAAESKIIGESNTTETITSLYQKILSLEMKLTQLQSDYNQLRDGVWNIHPELIPDDWGTGNGPSTEEPIV